MTELRDFLYLDTAKLYSLVSQIRGGLVSEINETIKQIGGLTGGVNVGLPSFGGKFDASKTTESEQQQSIRLTDPAYFNVLHQYLSNNNKISDLTASSIRTRNSLDVGQFIEMRAIVEPPIVESWIKQANALFDFVERNFKLFTATQKQGKGRAVPVMSTQQMSQFKSVLGFLTDYINLSRRDPGKQYICGRSEKQEYGIWCGLIPEFVGIPLQAALPADVRIFGRVERLLNDGEIWKIVDLTHFNQATQATQLLDVLNNFSSIMGQKQISENDLQAQYPDIIVTPIAIYR